MNVNILIFRFLKLFFITSLRLANYMSININILVIFI